MPPLFDSDHYMIVEICMQLFSGEFLVLLDSVVRPCDFEDVRHPLH